MKSKHFGICILIIALLLGGCSRETSTSADSKVCQDTFSFQYDDAYSQEIGQADSNFALCQVNEKYTQMYKSLIASYYEKLCAKAGNGLKQAIAEEQAAWEEYAQANLDMQLEYLEVIYGGGSIVPVLYTEAEYRLYREKALELSQRYEALCTEDDDASFQKETA